MLSTAASREVVLRVPAQRGPLHHSGVCEQPHGVWFQQGNLKTKQCGETSLQRPNRWSGLRVLRCEWVQDPPCRKTPVRDASDVASLSV